MFEARSILVDLDAVAGSHPALETALRVAQRGSARLKIVDVVPDVSWMARRFATGAVERDLVSHREEHLGRIAASAAATGLEIETAVLRGRASVALSREVIESKHDLLVRAHGRSGSVEARQFGAIDMQILRLCPCPVWLVAPSGSRLPLRVLVAIHSNPEDAAEQELNVHILDVTSSIVRPDAGEITVLQAWIAFAEQLVASRMKPEELAGYVDSMRGGASDALHALAPQIRERFGDVRLELVKGEPAEVIARFAAERSVDLVVMGTLARRGIQGFLMGNTAESTLQRLRCSVLAIKPLGFRSPIEAEDVQIASC
jgi:universal stress protein E